ncbi:hypothetical protein GCM10009609_47880 [Pseudonocardia aurantiaca]|uniref:Uncharacterized protein n=1 Tax=Pseudonocardia aurantiaca TaxID=75290 RepID=A0ABW4FXL9_9PSEU
MNAQQLRAAVFNADEPGGTLRTMSMVVAVFRQLRYGGFIDLQFTGKGCSRDSGKSA